MYTTILFFPVLGAFITGVAGRLIGSKGSFILTTYCLFSSALLSIMAFYEVGIEGVLCYINGFKWIESGLFNLNFGLLFDSLTVVMLIVVTTIALLVNIYSIEYMSNDPHLPRFFTYISIFTFSMLILVTSSNYLQMFIGWEGVGVSSYLLINFWFTRIQANKSAIKAMIVNRVGDFGLIMGIIAIQYVFKSTDFAVVFGTVSSMINNKILFFGVELDALTIIGILLFIGAIGKSAQIGLHTWLPDAMEGPTPVSALIHAATMVTAGVFMLLRSSPLIEYTPNVLTFITIIGALTAFFAATTGVAQNDLKRVIAYSTCSQLGYMIFACGLSCYSVSIFHLMNHAFFKALLFLSAGSVIHAIGDEQDMRRMGGLVHLLPFTYISMFIGSLSLMGIPFLTGFYSKDVILEFAFAKFHIYSSFSYWLGSISALFTAYYSFRLIYLTFFNKTNAFKNVVSSIHESPLRMIIPLFILGLGSIFIGYLTKDMFIGMGTDFWGNALFNLPENTILLQSEFLPFYVKNIPVLLSLLGAVIAHFIYSKYNLLIMNISTSALGIFIYRLWNKKYYFDVIYNKFIVIPLLSFGYHITFKLFDRGFIEFIGPTGIAALLMNITNRLSTIQSGYVFNYAFFIFIGITSSIAILIVNSLYNINIDIRYIALIIFTVFFVFFKRK